MIKKKIISILVGFALLLAASSDVVGKSYSSGSKSYSSGSSRSSSSFSSKSSGNSSRNSSPTIKSPSSSGKSYSSGGSSQKTPSSTIKSPSSTTKPNYSKKPPSTDFNSSLNQDLKKQESKITYQKSLPKDNHINKNQKSPTKPPAINKETYTSRESRTKTFYEPYINKPVVHYNDSFSVFFYLWLFDRCSADHRAEWAYHHRHEMDDARWKDMCEKDAGLEARVKQLENEKKMKDSSYSPPDFPKNQVDLMYSDEFVQKSIEDEEASFFFLTLIIASGVFIGLFVYILFFLNFNKKLF